MLKLVVSLPFGQIEKRFEFSLKGREAAFIYLRGLIKARPQVLSYQLIKLGA